MSGFLEIALQPICDDSWRCEGKRPELSDPCPFGRVLRAPGASLRSIQMGCSERGESVQCRMFMTSLVMGIKEIFSFEILPPVIVRIF